MAYNLKKPCNFFRSYALKKTKQEIKKHDIDSKSHCGHQARPFCRLSIYSTKP